MIIEAVMAVLILFGFVFLAMARQAQEAKAFQEKPSFYNIATVLIDKARGDDKVRGYVLAEEEGEVNQILWNYLVMINSRYNSTVTIRGVDKACSYQMENKDKEIYAADTVFAASPAASEPKKLCIFVWEK